MPTYVYVCETCGDKFEKVMPFDQDHDAVACPEGHRHVHRIYNAPTIVFKGKGFYVTDHPSSKKS
jgi:putative FmdB family regulatory protein